MLRSLLNAVGKQTDGMKSEKKYRESKYPLVLQRGERSDFQ